MSRVYNFSAGPAVLPEEVLKEAAAEMMDYNGTGMSVMEMSHRSKAFEEIITAAEQELKAGVTDAAVEKHVPVYTIEGSHVHVVVGETKHPMLEEHFIEWITLNTNQGIYRKQLNPGQEPVADFCLCDGEQVEEVYAYCNLHGLWKC